MRLLICALSFTSVLFAQQQPNVAAQRQAMKKLEFLVGHWSGTASVVRGTGEPLKLTQTEDVQFKLDGLVLLIEGTGRGADGQAVYHALATVSYDDAANAYHFRAYNDGRYVDTALAVTSNAFEWGLTSGPVKVNNVMKLTDDGDWQETTDVTMGSAPPRRTVEMKLRRQ
ncbi:MAG TPA: hypothetical protein VMH81_05645 [Bryobacteraceae bacterium]|nr:hypothetical protein [Bryobacteraceae bacterium]